MTPSCAKDPTELMLTVTADSTVTQPITSILVTVSGSGGTTSRSFQSLAAPAADAYIPHFQFPALLDLLITGDGVLGEVQVTVDASDPTVSTAVLASGGVPAAIIAAKTVTASVVLAAVPASVSDDGGVSDGASAAD